MLRFLFLPVFLLVVSTQTWAQDEEDDFASPMVVTPLTEETNPSLAMPPDGDFEAAPAPSDWEEEPGADEEMDGEEF